MDVTKIWVWRDKNSDWSPQIYSVYEDQTHVRSREGAEEQVKLKHALVDSHCLAEWTDCRISRAPCPILSRMPCSSSSTEAHSSFDSTFCWSRVQGVKFNDAAFVLAAPVSRMENFELMGTKKLKTRSTRTQTSPWWLSGPWLCPSGLWHSGCVAHVCIK